MTTPTQAVLNALLHIELLASTPEGLVELNRPSLGLCSTMIDVLHLQLDNQDTVLPEFEAAIALWDNTQKHLFMCWPEFSGNETYPIKVEPFTTPMSEDMLIDPVDQFNMSVTMYGHNAYGEARLRLVSYMVKNFRMALTEYQVICDRSNNPEVTVSPTLVECDSCPTSSGCVNTCMKAPTGGAA